MSIFNTFVGAVGCFCLFNLSNRRKSQVQTKVNTHASYTKIVLLVLSSIVLISGPLFNTFAQTFLFANSQQGVNTYLLNRLFISNI